MIFGAILAGGKGTRVGSDVPKQFLQLDGMPILIKTLNVFIESGTCDKLYISVNEMWLEYTQQLLEEFYPEEIRKNIKIVCGGKERIMSFLNVIKDIEETYGINENDIVLSHDAVRPFVTTEIIEDCIEKTKEYRVAMATVNSADTTYSSGREGYLTSTYDRKKLFVGQTPQGCKMDLIHEVINSYPEDELLKMTGTSQLFINKNIDVKISLGSVNNFKITTINDINFAEFLFKKDREQNNEK